MVYDFFLSDSKFGISKDSKSFCVVNKSGVAIYDDIDSYIDAIRDFLEFITKKDNKDE